MREIHKVVTIVIVASVLFCKIMFAIADGYPKAASEPTPTPDYPEWAAVNTEGMELETFEGPGFQVQCLADDWETIHEEFAEEYGFSGLVDDRLVLYYNEETMDAGLIIKNFGKSAPFSENALKVFTEGYSNEPSWTVLESKMYTFDGMPVGYIDVELTWSEDILDQALADGRMTEEALELAGGREAYISYMSSLEARELTMNFTKDGCLYTILGTYETPEQKQIVLDAMTIALQTLEPTE